MWKSSRSPADASSHHSAILFGCDADLCGVAVLAEEPFDGVAESARRLSSVNHLDAWPSTSSTPTEPFFVAAGSTAPIHSQPELASQSQCRSLTAASTAPCFVADRQLVSLRLASDRLVVPLSRAAAAFVRRSAWSPIGWTGASDFARERLGRSGRWLKDMAALGEGVARFPVLKLALTGADGGAPLSRVVATALARFATVEVIDEWIDLARRVTVRELLEAVRRARASGSKRAQEENPEVSQESAPGQEGSHLMLGSETEDEDDGVDLRNLRFLVPEPIQIAFYEGLDLHRAVSGHQASIASFAEALVAEACTGPHPIDVSNAPVRPGVSVRDIEMAHARATDNWRALSTTTQAADVFQAQAVRSREESRSDGRAEEASLDALVEQTLRAVADLESRAGEGTEGELADQIAECVRLEDEIERRIGQILGQMAQRGDWRTLGFAGTSHYASERLGMARRTAESRTAIERVLRERPCVRAAYEARKIGLEAAWLVCRALGRGRIEPGCELDWIEQGHEKTVKRPRDAVRLAELRDMEQLKNAAPISAAVPTSALIGRGGPQGIVGTEFRKIAPPATDAEWHAFIRRVPEMTRDRLRWLGKLGIDPRAADVFLRLRLPEDIADNLLAAIESARKRLEQRADLLPWTEPWPDPNARASVLAAREYVVRCRRVPAWVGLLELLEDYAETWDDPQLIPKRRWSRIYERDGYRCMAPGCTARQKIQDHHIAYRSHQGSDEPWNQITLCSFHHQQGEHGRFAKVWGTAPLDLTWRLGTPDLATWWKNERRLEGFDANEADECARD